MLEQQSNRRVARGLNWRKMAGTGVNDNVNGAGWRRGSGLGTILSTFGIRQGASGGGGVSSGTDNGIMEVSGWAMPIDIGRGERSQARDINSDASMTVPGAAGGGLNNENNHNNNNNNNSNTNTTHTNNTNTHTNNNNVNINNNNTHISNNILGTTPLDYSEHPAHGGPSSVPGGPQNTELSSSHLPINLVLGQIDTNGNTSNSQLDRMPLTSPPIQASGMQNGHFLKNVHHFIYPAVRPAAAPALHLDFPNDWPKPEPVEDETVRLRKDKNGLFTLRLTAFIDNPTAGVPGFYFDPIVRTAGPGSQLVIGRYTEKVREAISTIPEAFHPAVFKSKVVSRTHGVFKVDDRGNWFVKDVKSSSGTFLNHHRLSPASTMSKDYLLKDGDILQLGLNFRGGAEEIYRCVKMRVELNKSWRKKANAFNKEAIQKLKELQKMATGTEFEDCSICLSKIKPFQAVFIAPCSHSWHYQCVRRLVSSTYPQFVCPNCRAICDLEADLDSEGEDDDEFVDDDVYIPNEPCDHSGGISSGNDDSEASIPNGNHVRSATPGLDEDFLEEEDIQMMN